MINEEQFDRILSKCILKDIMINFIYENKEKLKNEKDEIGISEDVSKHLNSIYSIAKGTDLYTFIEDIKLSIIPRKITSSKDVEKIYYKYRKEFKNMQYELRRYVNSLTEIYNSIDKKMVDIYIPSAEEKYDIIMNHITSLEKKYENLDKEEKDIISVDFSIIDSPKYDACKDEYNYDLSKQLLMERISNDLEKTITTNGYKDLKKSENIYDVLEYFSSAEDTDSLDIFYSRNNVIQLILLFKNYHLKSDKVQTFLTLHHSLGRIDKSYSYLNKNINLESQEEDKLSLKDRLNNDYDNFLNNMECVKNLLYRGYCFMNLIIQKDYKNIIILKSDDKNIFVNKELQFNENIKNEDIIEYINYMRTTGKDELSMITLDRYTRTMENMVFDNKDYENVKKKEQRKKDSNLKDEIRNTISATLGRENGDFVYNIINKIKSKDETLNMKESILSATIRKDKPIKKFYDCIKSSEDKSNAWINFFTSFMKERKFLNIIEIK